MNRFSVFTAFVDRKASVREKPSVGPAVRRLGEPHGSTPIRELGLLLASAALFFLAFPNPLYLPGLAPLGFLALLPLSLAWNHAPWPRLFVLGPLAGLLWFGASSYWLAAYHPLAMGFVALFMSLEYLVLAVLFRLARTLFPRQGFWVQALVWVGFEWLRSQGFLGFPYGIMAYSQYQFLPLARFAAVSGLWGVSALVVFPAIWLGSWLSLGRPGFGAAPSAPAKSPLRWVPPAIWGLAFLVVLAHGFLVAPDYGRDRTLKIVLVQQNMDPWVGGVPAYQKSVERLKRQSAAGLAAEPAADLLVWAETAVIPGIEWNFQRREEPQRAALVKDLKAWMQALPVPLLLGNGEREERRLPDGSLEQLDFNAALLYRGGELQGSYRKHHLVPFTEYFPYGQELPWLKGFLVDNHAAFWEPGAGPKLLELNGIKLGTPICFEDSFPEISQAMVAQGAQLLVNLSNDLWSKSEAGARQHLAMASFRSIEQARSMVRATNGGMSALILPDGTISRLAPAFAECWLAVEAPLHQGETAYQLWGDAWGWGAAGLAGLALLIGCLAKLPARLRGPRGKTD